MHDIQEALNSLGAKLDSNDISSPECDVLLAKLHNYTKCTSGGELQFLFGRKEISTLGGYAFQPFQPTTSRLALRSIHNILMLAATTRRIFVDEKYPSKLVALLKSDDEDDILLSARLLLLCSTESTLNFVSYFEKDRLAEILISKVSRYAKEASLPPTDPASPINACLALISTLSARYEAQSYRFLDSLPSIIEMLNKAPIPSPPLEPPVSVFINCLASIPFKTQRFPTVTIEKLVKILDLAIRAYSSSDINTRIVPLIGLLIQISQSTALDNKACLSARLLPSEKDRETVLGEGDSLPHILLKLASELIAPNHIPILLFELSDKDPKQFIHNVGFGYGSGMLFSMGIPISQEDLKAENVDFAKEDLAINPVTGQKLDMEPRVDLPEMTDEEKEREAEKLFVLFERLNANGLITIENPVAQAMRSGQLDEQHENPESSGINSP